MTETQADLFKKSYPITNPRHRDQLMQVAAIRAVIDALKAPQSSLPGMQMAIALAEKVEAEERVALAGLAYRAAAAAGVDLSTCTAIYTQFSANGRDLELLVESAEPGGATP